MKTNTLTDNSDKIVLTEDAVSYLKNNPTKHKVIITSLPDADEIQFTIPEWENWIKSTSKVIIDSLAEDAVVFFYQTDRKYNGRVIDKKNIITSVFLQNGYNQILSKIVLKQKPNTVNFFRPTYTNLFAFSKKYKAGKSTPDVIDCGKMIYKNAMGYNACEVCVNYLINNNIKEVVFDPFCGQGSVLKIANDMGFKVLGIDIDPQQTELAKKLLNI